METYGEFLEEELRREHYHTIPYPGLRDLFAQAMMNQTQQSALNQQQQLMNQQQHGPFSELGGLIGGIFGGLKP